MRKSAIHVADNSWRSQFTQSQDCNSLLKYCVTSLLQKRVVKVNFCLFCAKNVLGLGVEFFALFQDGLLVVVVVDGIGPKLCFQAKTATLGVVCFSQLSAKKVSAVKLYAGHIGVAIQRDACFD